MLQSTSVAVIGAGHAGIEAALACARTGIDTVLFTMSLDAIGNMPCNPSIGGTGKGHLVYEIDALGGEMGRAADAVTLQSRTLNLGKGAAVHSKRVQADRRTYQRVMKQTLENSSNLRLIQAEIVDVGVKDGEVCSVTTSLGEEWTCQKVIICSGTYLAGRVFVGDKSYESGPDGMLAAKGLSDCLRSLGIRLMRFKTGTPARVLRRTVDTSRLERQDGEDNPIPYHYANSEEDAAARPSLPCHIVYTNAETHKVIRDNIHRSAMYSGQIHGTGPRYCPSIEDKLVRFADKERHQLFLEPMGADTEEMYIQGFSTSLPTDVQHSMLSTLTGFEHAQIMRYAYAIEYDCADPLRLLPTLEFKEIRGLYGAGQFNGTSGYEEAAAQGLVAGLNASLSLRGLPAFVPLRAESYLGTLIDDLVTKGTNEPYRMMTSRSEYRLLLRQDNADERLTEIGYRAGLVTDVQYQAFLQKQEKIKAETERLESTYLSPSVINPLLDTLGEANVNSGASLADLLRRPAITYEALAPIDVSRETLPKRITLTVETNIKYAGYVKRQLAEVRRQSKLEEKLLPEDICYECIKGLRIEAAQKLAKIRPRSIGQASRISGVNPADISVLLIYLGIK